MAIWTTPRTWTEAQLVGSADLNQHLRDNLQSLYDAQHDVATRKTIVSPYTMVSASTGTRVFSTDFSWTADGSTYVVEFFAGAVTAVTAAATIVLTNGSVGTILAVLGVVSAGATVPVCLRYYYTPAAGTVNVNVVGVFGSAGSGTIQAGNGGSTITSYPPASLRVFGVPV